MAAPFRPRKRSQFEPRTTTSSKDCVATVTGALISRATLGRLHPTHADIRAASGAPATRGLYLSEAAAAAKRYGVELEVVRLSRNLMRDTVGNGCAVGIIIDTRETAGTECATGAYLGRHLQYVSSYTDWPKGEVCACEKHTAVAHGEYTYDDPGTVQAGYRQISAELLYRAAARSSGQADGLDMLVAPDTEGVKHTVTGGTWARVSPDIATGATRRLSKGQVVFIASTVNGAGGAGWGRAAAGDYIREAYLDD